MWSIDMAEKHSRFVELVGHSVLINKEKLVFPHFLTVCRCIDHRATYVYRIGNRRALPKVMHWAALKYFPEYSRFSERSPFEAICQTHGLTVECFTAKTRVSGILEIWFALSEASFICQR